MNTWSETILMPFQSLWAGVVNYLPNIVLAIVFVVIGWIIGIALAKVVRQIVHMIRLDQGLQAAGIDEIVGRTGVRLDSGAFLGALVKWFVIIAFFVLALDILGLDQINQFLQQVVLNYLPNVIAAVLILLLSGVIGEFTRRAVVRAAKAAEVHSAGFAGTVAKWSIWIFGILAALLQLGIAARIIEILFQGVVVALALAFGLSFGLGGQSAAAGYVEKIRSEMSNRD
jgi:Conserved TM helix